MIEKTISEIEAKIGGAESVSAERKAELLKLLGTLKTEVAKLSETHSEQADSIAEFRQPVRARGHARRSQSAVAGTFQSRVALVRGWH